MALVCAQAVGKKMHTKQIKKKKQMIHMYDVIISDITEWLLMFSIVVS